MPKITRRIEEPNLDTNNTPGPNATSLAYCHNDAVEEYGSDSGLFHAFDPEAPGTASVGDGVRGFPRGTVVSRLSWGRIDARLAQALLDQDGVA